jgi:hypothetical protein
MKINGINRTVTFPTRVKFSGTCDLIGGMTYTIYDFRYTSVPESRASIAMAVRLGGKLQASNAVAIRVNFPFACTPAELNSAKVRRYSTKFDEFGLFKNKKISLCAALLTDGGLDQGDLGGSRKRCRCYLPQSRDTVVQNRGGLGLSGRARLENGIIDLESGSFPLVQTVSNDSK